MKLATFQVQTPVGPFDRFGIVLIDGGADAVVSQSRSGQGRVVDVNSACAAMLADRGHLTAEARARALAPSNLRSFVEIHETDQGLLQEILDWAVKHPDAKGTRGEQLFFELSDVTLRPPVTRVDIIRDFAAFEDHLQNTFGKMGIAIPEEWYEAPMAFKANPTMLYGHDDPVRWPAYTEKMDYELEIAAIIGREVQDIELDEAESAILGYTLLNDFSARDTQRGEMRNNTGPFKGKDFAWVLGPWIVTPDELGDPSNLAMQVVVNDEVWASSSPGAMKWSFPEMVAYTAQDERLNIGDVFGSGTVNQGCGFEIDRWIKEGDIVELEAEKIGVLRNKVLPRRGEKLAWQRQS